MVNRKANEIGRTLKILRTREERKGKLFAA